MTNVITVYQPYASLIMAGVKTWETRGNPPHGDMCPEGVRGLPGRRINAGDRILIHAAAREPVAGADVGGWWWEPDMGDPVIVSLDDHRQIPAPLGVILGTVEVVRVLPVGSMPGCEYLADDLHVCLNGNGRLDLVDHDNGDDDITDQLLYGNWLPGGWAWELADPIPTTEQCPDGCTRFHGRMPGHVYGSNWDWVPCQTCGGAMTCPPIPVKGKQGVWQWTT